MIASDTKFGLGDDASFGQAQSPNPATPFALSLGCDPVAAAAWVDPKAEVGRPLPTGGDVLLAAPFKGDGGGGGGGFYN